MSDDTAMYGSRRLAEALASSDVPAIGRALRMDVVLLPLLEIEGAESQVRVFPSPDPSRPYRLFLFSSADAYEAFLDADDPQRSFSIVPGRSVAAFLDANLPQLELVAFDPGSEHPMTASPEDVRAILEPRADDDQVAWVTGEEQPEAALPPGASFDFTGFRVVDPSEGDAAVQLVDILVGRTVTFMPKPRQPTVRAWADDLIARTRGGTTTSLGVLQLGGPMNATLVAMWPQWRAGAQHVEHLAAAARARGESVDEFDGAAGTIVRHEHVEGPTLLIDHWISGDAWAFALRVCTDADTDRTDEVRDIGAERARGVTFVV